MHMYEQPHLQNFITHTHYPILKRREHPSDTIITINPQLLTSLEEGPVIYVVEATTEEGLSEDSVTFADLFYHDSDDHFTALGPPGLSESMHKPAHAESWADDLSDLVFEMGGNHMVVMMQPQYKEEDNSWLLNILLDEEEEDN